MSGVGYPQEVKERVLSLLAEGKTRAEIRSETGIGTSTIGIWKNESGLTYKDLRKKHAPAKERILIYDIETLPNLGYFFDTYSDRAIPLEFIKKPKSICTIAYKWYGETETYVLVIDTPYEDKGVLEAFLPVWEEADYVVAHYSRFDKPFIAARLMANDLPPLPPVNDICTYKLAKAHFGRSLNGNKLDHLGTILGVGKKIKTSADLWVGCADGDAESLEKMAAYNKQDVDLLEEVFRGLLPHVKSKLNLNLQNDSPVQLCKHCGSDNLTHKGFEYTPNSMRHRFQCNDCDSWSTFPKKKVKCEQPPNK